MDKEIWTTIYNGDTDLACNMLGDEWFVDDLMGIQGDDNYRTWKLEGSSQVAGWTKDWDRLSFVTVRGAGHMVPQWKPQEALKMIEAFINHQKL